MKLEFIESVEVRQICRSSKSHSSQVSSISSCFRDIKLIGIQFIDAYEAEQLLKEVDIHSVTGNLKSYLRELPEALFTDHHYQKVTLNQHNAIIHHLTPLLFFFL